MNWQTVKDFLTPNWRKGCVFFLITTVYLLISYWAVVAGSSFTESALGVCTYEWSSLVKKINYNMSSVNVTDTTEKLMEHSRLQESKGEKIKLLTDFSSMMKFILSPGMTETLDYLFFKLLDIRLYGSTIFSTYQNFKAILLFLYWYCVSCLIVWVYGKLRDKRE